LKTPHEVARGADNPGRFHTRSIAFRTGKVPGIKLLALLQRDGSGAAATHIEREFQLVADDLTGVDDLHFIAAEIIGHAEGERVAIDLALRDGSHGRIAAATARAPDGTSKGRAGDLEFVGSAAHATAAATLATAGGSGGRVHRPLAGDVCRRSRKGKTQNGHEGQKRCFHKWNDDGKGRRVTLAGQITLFYKIRGWNLHLTAKKHRTNTGIRFDAGTRAVSRDDVVRGLHGQGSDRC